MYRKASNHSAQDVGSNSCMSLQEFLMIRLTRYCETGILLELLSQSKNSSFWRNNTSTGVLVGEVEIANHD